MWEKLLNQQGKKVKNNNKEINVDLNKKLVRFITDRIQTLHNKELKNTHKKNKTVGYIMPDMAYYPRNR